MYSQWEMDLMLLWVIHHTSRVSNLNILHSCSVQIRIDTTTPKQILTQTEYLGSICQDVELMQFFVNHFVSKLWTSVFRDEKKGSTVNEVRKEVKTGKKFHDTVTEIFLSQYDAMEKLEISRGYSFSEPRLMQLYVAYKVKSQSSFANFSGTGAGKT
jgi:hypothetical protein